MSSTAWTDLNSKGDILKLHNLCGKDGCKCQRNVCFTSKQFEVEGSEFKNTMKEPLEGSQKA